MGESSRGRESGLEKEVSRGDREGEGCVCVCVCLREREREREW